MHNIVAIFKRQIMDTLKNKETLIQFVMFPVLTVIMSRLIHVEGMPGNYFVNLFASMYIGMAPLTAMAAVMAEEKEKNTLRVLLLSNVKPYEYLMGVGGYVWAACMLGGLVICMAGGYDLGKSAAFMGILAVGFLVSILVGAVIGTWSRNQMMATSLTVPVMLLFAFLPMLSLFNDSIAKVARFTYSEQISRMLYHLEGGWQQAEGIGVVAGNLVLFAGLFAVAYRKCGLE